MARIANKKKPTDERKSGAIKTTEHKEVRSYEQKTLENVKRKHAKMKFKTFNVIRNGIPATVEVAVDRDEKPILQALQEPCYFY